MKGREEVVHVRNIVCSRSGEEQKDKQVRALHDLGLGSCNWLVETDS